MAQVEVHNERPTYTLHLNEARGVRVEVEK